MRPSPEGERLRKRTEERSPLSTALPRAKASASRRLHVETMYCHSQRTHWKWAKRVICPLVKDAQDCQKDVSNGYQYENSTHLEHDDAQCKTEVTNARRTRFSNENDLQKWFKMMPQGVQMVSKIHSGGILGGKAEKNTFLKASRTPQGPLLGGHLGGQNRSKAVMEAFPTRN